MQVIDADAHVIEWERTWEYMDESEARFKPMSVSPGDDPKRRFWIIDGKVKLRRANAGSDTPVGSQELTDVPARLAHMDELGTDIQVIYPSLWTTLTFSNPGVEKAICHSYNRWMADVWAQSNNRLRWTAVVPVSDMDAAIEQANFAKENGACGINLRPFEGNRHLSDPYYGPLFEEVGRLNMPICIHAGIGNDAMADMYSSAPDFGNFIKFKLSVVSAFHTAVMGQIPQKFPDLRFGFVEVSSQWVPYAVHDIVRRIAWRSGHHLEGKSTSTLLAENRLFVACQTDDDLETVLRYSGEDNIVMGTDYGHADTSTELLALQTLQQDTGLSKAVTSKILDANARALYGL